MQNIFLSPITKKQAMEINPIVLAFIGDGIHTLFVRDRVVKSQNLQIGKQHKKASEECCARSQAKALDLITPFLTEEEHEIVKRTRNSKNHQPPKNTDPETYKKATCFESLIGFLYLVGDYSRIKELLEKR